jgi:Putative prokaryotic signal transducing protein
MKFRDPIAVYNAANNLEAALVRQMLLVADIESHVVEDVSLAGAWMFGLLPEIHKPQVWIDRGDIERAKPVLEEYERCVAAKLQTAEVGAPIVVTCEECEGRTSYPASRNGSVETCPHCGAYVDVGCDVSLEGWDLVDPTESEET